MRTIKRYENRKLYDTEASSYVSLRDIAALVQDGERVEVIDNVSGEDITAQTLTTVILEEGKRGPVAFSAEFLHDLLRQGNAVLDSSLDQLRAGLEGVIEQSLQSVSKAARLASRDDIDTLQDRLEELEDTIDALVEQAEEQ